MKMSEKRVFTDTGIGQRVERKFDREKVAGTLQYADDLPFGKDLLHARAVRSPIASGNIRSIDARKALAIPGVVAVITGKDFPYRFGLYLKDRTPIAIDRVRYVGEPVALVVATSESIADRAAELIHVDYQELPAVFDMEKAANDTSILVHPDLEHYERVSFINPQPGTNIGNWFKIRRGDIEEAFAKSDYIVEERMECPQIAHGFLETHCCVAKQDMGTGDITVWSSAQSVFAVREILAEGLGIDNNRIRVIAPPIGGGFGGKAGMTIEALCLSAAMNPAVKGRPVKLFIPREEVMLSSWVRQAYIATIKMGITKEGKILGIKNAFYFDTGISAEYGVNPVRSAGYTSTGTYYIPNVWTDSYAVYTNKPFGGAYRGFGLPELMSAMEVVVDIAAKKIGMHPVEFRLKNLLRPGLPTCTGMPMSPHALDKIIEKARAAIRFDEKESPVREGFKRGKGMALAIKAPAKPADAASSAIVKINADGTAEVQAATMDMGQGAYTAYAQMVSEELGIPYDRIRLDYPDSATSPYDWQTVASRSCWAMGAAVKAAATDARQQLLALYAEYWQVEPEDIVLKNGFVLCPKKNLSESFGSKLQNGFPMPDGKLKGGPIIGRGRFVPADVVNPDAETGQSPKSTVHFTVGAIAIDVEVSESTGEVAVNRVVAGYDVGKAISPVNIQGQIEGGTVQGISAALFEGLVFDEKGKLLNQDFTDYKIATIEEVDFPIDSFWEETPEEISPYGNRGVGEHAMISPAPALNNAVYNAIGIRFHRYPLTRERVFMAARSKTETTEDWYE
jgi:carbon-monoxide dehydrogenase large subunit